MKLSDFTTLAEAQAYTGTPTTIERQVRYADGANEVVLAWATYDASPAGGTFTGTIDLTANVRPHTPVRLLIILKRET